MMPSWFSEIFSSNSDTSMPRLSTPRMVPTCSVMSLPGMKAPGGTNTPFMPVRAFGAPHTTWIGAPLPVSTMHTRNRSALGCCFASVTRAMTNGASSLVLSSMRSTSSPIMVSLSASSPSERSVSRCSLSQRSVNFIMALQAQSARQRREIERAEAVMIEPAHVGLEERAQVRHAVFEHGNAVDPHAPGKALIFVGIEPAILHHVRVHHAAAENLHPVVALAEADFAFVAAALDVDFERRLGEGKKRRAKAHADAIDFEKRLEEFFENPFQVAEVRALVDDQSLDLMKHRRVRLVRIAAIGATGNDDADRRLLRQHGAHLHRRGVRAQ